MHVDAGIDDHAVYKHYSDGNLLKITLKSGEAILRQNRKLNYSKINFDDVACAVHFWLTLVFPLFKRFFTAN